MTKTIIKVPEFQAGLDKAGVPLSLVVETELAAVRKAPVSAPVAARSTDDTPSFTVGVPQLLVDGREAAFRHFLADVFAATDMLLATRREISRSVGLTTTQFAIFFAVSQLDGPPSIRRIADRLRIAATNVTTEVNRLVERGLLLKRVSSRDLRALEIHFTVKGREILKGLLPLSRATNDMLFAQMTAEEMRIITKVCGAIVAAGEDALHMIATRTGQPNPPSRRVRGRRPA